MHAGASRAKSIRAATARRSRSAPRAGCRRPAPGAPRRSPPRCARSAAPPSAPPPRPRAPPCSAGSRRAPWRARQVEERRAAAVVGRHRGGEVGQVLAPPPGWATAPARSRRSISSHAALACAQQVGGREDHALLGERAGVGRHRARPRCRRARRGGRGWRRSRAARRRRRSKTGVINGHVRQVRAAEGGMVGDHRVAGLERQRVAPPRARTRPSAPRCTGMCGALTTSSPRGVEHARRRSRAAP